MNKIILLIGVQVILSLQVFSQIRSASPFSRYGMGDMSDRTFSQNRAMGHTGIGLRTNNHINLLNPASYSAIDTLNFIMQCGFRSQLYTFSENNNKVKNSCSYLDYIAMLFPVNKWWGTTFSYLPFSSTGYDLTTQRSSILGTTEYQYRGRGGFNQVLIGNAITIKKAFSLGINASYIYGESKEIYTVAFQNKYVIAGYAKLNSKRISGFLFDAGTQYTQKLPDNKSIIIGATFTPAQQLGFKNADLVQSDTMEYKNKMDSVWSPTPYPTSYGIGVSFAKKDKYIFAFDYKAKLWRNLEIYGEQPDYLTNIHGVYAGMEYIPYKYSAKKYHKRINYRFGGHYKTTNILLKDNETNEHQVYDAGIIAGVGFPFRQTKNTINIAIETGKRFTDNKLLLSEQYINFHINFTLQENWFYKPKYD
ncbi:MAG: hypothetical protein SNJ71_06670 [Bacteroidales bacterium]